MDAQRGWVCGWGGTILRTVDGGQTWEAQASGTDVVLEDIFFADANRGWAVGGSSGVILATTNGGDTWVAQTSPVQVPLSQVFFVSPTHGWAVGGTIGLGFPPAFVGHVLRTTNGGATWFSVDCPAGRLPVAMHFVNANNGWLLGASFSLSGFGMVSDLYVTANGGWSWTKQVLPPPEMMYYGMHFASAQTGWLVGERGWILRTANGGIAWQQQESSIWGDLEAVQFVNANEGWILAENRVLYTASSGQSWRRQVMHPACRDLTGLHMADSGHGWVVGGTGTICAYRPK